MKTGICSWCTGWGPASWDDGTQSLYDNNDRLILTRKREGRYLSNCHGAPLIEDGERSHDE